MGGLRPNAICGPTRRDLGVKDTYDLILSQLRGGGWKTPEEYPEYQVKILMSCPSGGEMCEEQVPHYDYNISKIKPSSAMPYSALTALEGDATSISLLLDIGKGLYHEIVVPMLPGDTVLWSGAILHRGRPYALPNMRMFAYFPTKSYPPADQLVLMQNIKMARL